MYLYKYYEYMKQLLIGVALTCSIPALYSISTRSTLEEASKELQEIIGLYMLNDLKVNCLDGETKSLILVEDTLVSITGNIVCKSIIGGCFTLEQTSPPHLKLDCFYSLLKNIEKDEEVRVIGKIKYVNETFFILNKKELNKSMFNSLLNFMDVLYGVFNIKCFF